MPIRRRATNRRAQLTYRIHDGHWLASLLGVGMHWETRRVFFRLFHRLTAGNVDTSRRRWKDDDGRRVFFPPRRSGAEG